MTPKKLILFSSAILGMMGVLVSVIIIAIGGGFSGPGPSILNPPSTRDLWVVGNNITNDMELNYSLADQSMGSPSTNEDVSMKFFDEGKDWRVLLTVSNNNVSKYNLTFSKVLLIPTGILDAPTQKILMPISKSIFVIRDIAREPKYLVVGAIWDTINVGASTLSVRIVGVEKIDTPAGSFTTYVLGYEIGKKQSKLHLVKELPLPIKAEVYNANGTLQYKYELESIKRGVSD
jgi:hypothetical protein